MGKEDFKCFSQEFYRKVFDLVKHEGFYPYEYMSSFEKFKKEFPSKQRLYIRWLVKRLVIKSMSMFLRFGKNLKWSSRLVLKILCFIIADAFEKFRNSSLKLYGSCPRHNIYLDASNLYGYVISKFQCPTNAFKLIDPKEFDSNKFSSNGSKGCALEFHLEYPKELRKLYNDYSILFLINDYLFL